MNTQNRVFNKLAEETKVELATQKIELGLIDDLDKKLNSFKSKNKEIGSYLEQIVKLKSKFKNDFKSLGKEYDDLINGYDELFKKANEIGAKDISKKSFIGKNNATKYFGQGWDNEVLRFAQK
jgi:predicted nuclease with TOPRIM domain